MTAVVHPAARAISDEALRIIRDAPLMRTADLDRQHRLTRQMRVEASVLISDALRAGHTADLASAHQAYDDTTRALRAIIDRRHPPT